MIEIQCADPWDYELQVQWLPCILEFWYALATDDARWLASLVEEIRAI